MVGWVLFLLLKVKEKWLPHQVSFLWLGSSAGSSMPANAKYEPDQEPVTGIWKNLVLIRWSHCHLFIKLNVKWVRQTGKQEDITELLVSQSVGQTKRKQTKTAMKQYAMMSQTCRHDDCRAIAGLDCSSIEILVCYIGAYVQNKY